MQICKLKGLLDTSVDGTHGLKQWGTRLVSAAAEGVSSYDFELLLEAGSGEHHCASVTLQLQAKMLGKSNLFFCLKL